MTGTENKSIIGLPPTASFKLNTNAYINNYTQTTLYLVPVMGMTINKWHYKKKKNSEMTNQINDCFPHYNVCY